MANKGRSDPDIFGGYTHYDENGRKTGRSEPGISGGYTNYDASGKKTGRSDPTVSGGFIHYDSDGRKTGRSEIKATGGFTHYDASGEKTGESYPMATGGFKHTSGTDGCYIATCIYGSYDCPEVCTLRSFRDQYLRRSLPGRVFINTYYAVSPRIVARFGKNGFFRKTARKLLDRFVSRLRTLGYSDSNYSDRK